MAIYTAEELLEVVTTGLSAEAFGNLVQLITDLMAKASPGGVLDVDNPTARYVQTMLVRLHVREQGIRSEHDGDYEYESRSLRFEQPRLLRLLGKTAKGR